MACNSIEDNAVDDPNGSIVLMQDQGYLRAERFAMRRNHAAHAIRLVSAQLDTTNIADCLFADNQTGQELILAEDGSPLKIDSCTFANDQIAAGHAIHAQSSLSLTRSIIDETDTLALDYSGGAGNLAISYVLSNEIGTVVGAIFGTPKFVDMAGGDYHLQPNSIGIEYAPAFADDLAGELDLDGNPRYVDLPLADVYGYRDLGPYERQNLFQCGAQDSLFCNGFDH